MVLVSVQVASIIVVLSMFERHLTGAVPFDVQPNDVEVTEGELAILRCRVTDYVEVSLYWRSLDQSGNLEPLVQGRDVQKYSLIHGDLSRRLSIGGDPSHGEYNLIISNVTMEDQRQYVCTALKDGVAHDSRSATVFVRHRHPPPGVKDMLPPCSTEVVDPRGTYRIGAEVRFTCAAPARFTGEMKWIRVGGQTTILATCPGSPCEISRVLTIDDANVTFACDILNRSAIRDSYYCTSTPLKISMGCCC